MFYKVEIQTLLDGSQAIAPIVTYEDATAAEIAYHQSVAANLQSNQLKNFLVMIISEVGTTTIKKFYNFAIPEPEPEPEPSNN